MAKPTWAEISEFKDWMVERGYETDRDRTRFKKGKDGIALEFWIGEGPNGSFKCLNAQVQLNFVDTWFHTAGIFRTGAFMPCKTLSHEYVLMCELQHRKIELETESFFAKANNLIAETTDEIKKINRGAQNA
jgi:hypothetical protein